MTSMASGRFAPFSHAGPPRSLAKSSSFPRCYGPEFRGRALAAWSEERQVRLEFIQPGKPVQNAYVESFNGRLRDECLNANWFTSLSDARRKIESWRQDYNQQRPHSWLEYLPPSEFARTRAEMQA